MKKAEIKVGELYVAKVGANLTTVRVDSVGDSYRSRTRYGVTNMVTRRVTTFYSAMRFRSKVRPCPTCKLDVVYGCKCSKEERERQMKVDKVFERVNPHQVATQEINDDAFKGERDAIEHVNDIERENLAKDPHYYDATASNPAIIDNTDEYTLDEDGNEIPVTAPEEKEPARPFVPAVVAQPNPIATTGTRAGASAGLGNGFGLAGNIKDSKPAPHVQVQALAGTGKTTTLVEGMKRLRGMNADIQPSPQQQAVWDAMAQGKRDSIRFAAFGRAIARELQERLARFGLDKMGCEASTFHSMGCKAVNKAFGRQSPDNAAWVVMDYAAEIMGADVRDLRKEPRKFRLLKAVDELVGLCKQNLADGGKESLDALTSHYDVDTEGVMGEVYELVPQVLERCKNPTGRITFDDMVYLPVIHNLQVPRADMLLVDEVQDLNRMQQELAMMAAHRLLMVGDENQSIMAFAGADAQSMHNMRERLNAVPLPLTVTRRCGKAIVKEVQRYVPTFEAHESNCEGRIERARCTDWNRQNGQAPLADADYKRLVLDGDFILCRTNAPLVRQCFRFIRMGRKANIQGRDVGRGLKSTVEKLCKPYERVDELIRKLTDWLAKEQAKEMAKRYPSQNRIDALQDRADCLVCFTEGASTVQNVLNKIEAIFTDDKMGLGVRLSSIHRAKGLEANNVFILQPANGPREDKMQPWERQQESNLEYVAITRAIQTLTYVS